MNDGDLVYGGSPRAGDILRIRGALDEVPQALILGMSPIPGGRLKPLSGNVPHLAALPITKQEVNATLNLKNICTSPGLGQRGFFCLLGKSRGESYTYL
jgi:hypothetical protein